MRGYPSSACNTLNLQPSPALKNLSLPDFRNSRIGVFEIDASGGICAQPTSTVEHDWFLFTPTGTLFHPDFFGIVGNAMAERPDVSIFYFDHAVGDSQQRVVLKPAWDRTLFLVQDYVGLPLLVRAAALSKLGGLDAGCGSASAFDLVLRAHDAGLAIERIEQILSFGPIARSSASDRRKVLEHWVADTRAPYAIEEGLTADTLKMSRLFTEHPHITLVVPTRQGTDGASGTPFIRMLLDSLATTDYPMSKLTVIVGDDEPDGSSYAATQWPFKLIRVVTERASGEMFNYAAKMNRLWRTATTEHLVLMNDDITVQDGAWLQSLLTYSLQEDVGGVGARLLYPSGRIQHAGMAGGVYGLCTHAWINETADRPTYEDWAVTPKEWSMVTGAVFATRKSVLEEMNGFDERFTLDFNDVDLCMRMRMSGYRIIYTPHATLIHHEKGSRGAATWPGSQLALFLERWEALLSHDPAFNAKLNRNTHVIQLGPDIERWWPAKSN